MPRKKAAAAADAAQEFLEQSLAATLAEAGGRTDEDAAEFLESFGGSASFCRIERILRSGEKENCETVPYDDVRDDIVEHIRREWGAGRYYVALLNAAKRFVARRTVAIAVRSNAASPIGAAAQPGAAGAYGSEQLAMMREQMAADRQLLLTLLSQNREQKGPDIGSILQGVAALTKQGDPAAMFAAMMTAFQTVRSANPEVDSMARARELIGLAKELAPGAPAGEESNGESWLGVVKEVGVKLLDTVRPAVAAAAIAPRPALPAAAALPAGDAAIPAEGEQTMESFVSNIRAGIAFLRVKAKAGRPADFWVDYLFEESADLRFNAIIHAVQSGAAIEQLFEIAPEIAADAVEAAWFKELYVGIRRALEVNGAGVAGVSLGSSARTDLDSSGPGGDGADAGNHGVSGGDR